jgi:hypothetical protein
MAAATTVERMVQCITKEDDVVEVFVEKMRIRLISKN